MARAEAHGAFDRALEATAPLGLIYLHYLTGGESPEREVIAQVRAAIAVLAASDGQRGLMQAWRILTNVHFAGCRYLDATEAAERMVEHARLAGDRADGAALLPGPRDAARSSGPTPVPEAIAIVEDVLERIRWRPQVGGHTRLRALANLEAMRGRFDEARSLCRRSRATLEQLGWRFDAALTSAHRVRPGRAHRRRRGGRGGRAAPRPRDARGDGRAQLHLDHGRLPRRGALPPGSGRRGPGHDRGERVHRRCRGRRHAVPVAQRACQAAGARRAGS